MSLNLSIDEVLTTTRSVRKRLDLTKPVPAEVLTECLELAIQAPTVSNAQGWQWVFVDDPDKKGALADVYRANAMPYLNEPKPDYGDGDVRNERMDLVSGSAKFLAEHLHEVPVMLIPPTSARPSGWRSR
jgi:nitroreductase